MIVYSPSHPLYNSIEQVEIRARIEANKVSGYVYLLQPVGVKVYKIGCAVDLGKRMARYKSKYKFPVEYVAAIHYPDYYQAEQTWQMKYSDYSLCSEWFVLPETEVQYFISQVK